MRRRTLLAGMVVGITGLAGCTSSEEDDAVLDSTIQITDALCGEFENKAEISQQSKSAISINGVIKSVAEGQGLTSSLYGPAEDKSIICRVSVTESADEIRECSGSVSYSLEIKSGDIDLIEVMVLHYNDEESTSVANLPL